MTDPDARRKALEEMLADCRDTFDDYACSHEAKAAAAEMAGDDREAGARSAKAQRNLEMVRRIDALFGHPVPDAPARGDEGVLKSVTAALWPLLGGNHLPAETWHEVNDAVSAALASSAGSAGDGPK